MQDNRETDAEDGLSAFEEFDPISVVSDLSDLPQPSWNPTKTLLGQGHDGASSAGDAYAEDPIAYGQSAASLASARFDLDGPDEPQDNDVTVQVEGAPMAPEQLSNDLAMNWDQDEELATSHFAAGDPSDAGSIAPAGNPSPFPFGSSGPPPAPAPNFAMTAQGLGAVQPVQQHLAAPPQQHLAPQASMVPAPTHAAAPLPPAPPMTSVQAPAAALAPSLPPPSLPPPPPPTAGLTADDVDFRRGDGEGFLGSRIGLLLAMLLLCGVSLWAAYAVMGVGTGTVQVATVPEDVQLQVDGKPVAAGQTSPFELTLAAGKAHQLTMSKSGFAPKTMTVEAGVGETKALDLVELEAVAQADTGFAVASEPAGAQIIVDGQPTGLVTPARVTGVAAGEHKVALLPPEGYARLEFELSVVSGAVTSVPTVTLGAATAEAAEAVADGEDTSAPSAGADGNDADMAGAERLAAAEEQYDRRVARQTAKERARVRAEAAAERRARARATPRREPVVRMRAEPKPAAATGTGRLRVNSRPWSNVTLNGRRIGSTPILNHEVPAGRHTLKLHNPDLDLSQTIQVNVGSGKTVTKRVTLVP